MVFSKLPAMYTPDRYKNTDRKELIEFIKKNLFGILVLHDGERPVATHIPMMLHEKNGELVLIGHISKENEQGKLFHNSPTVLAIFNGPQAYVSSSWYNHENVSTWNYTAVHVYGKIKEITDMGVYEHLIHITDEMESKSEKPKYFKNISPRVLRENITGVTCFEITVEKIQASFKLSQDKSSEDHSSIIRELEKRGDASSKAVAEEMKKRGHE